jgi:hypothetical protein
MGQSNPVEPERDGILSCPRVGTESRADAEPGDAGGVLCSGGSVPSLDGKMMR